jgi:hypothetical protein
MFLDKSYADLVSLIPYVCGKIDKVQGGGLSKPEMLSIIHILSKKPPILIECKINRFMRTDEMMAFIKDRKAILSAVSLNFKGVGHCTFWDGKKLHDPSRKKTFTIETINPFEIII